MDHDIEILPSSSYQSVASNPVSQPIVVRRQAFGSGTSATTSPYGVVLPPHRGAGVPPALLRVERQLPLSFQRTNQHYDGRPAMGYNGANGKVVFLPRANPAAPADGGLIRRFGERVIPRGAPVCRTEAAGAAGRYAISGQLTRMQPAGSPFIRRNFQASAGVAVRPIHYSQMHANVKYEENPGGGDDQRFGVRAVQRLGNAQTRVLHAANVEQHRALASGFRRVDYNAVRIADIRRAVPGENNPPFYVKREPYDWPPRLVPVGGASGGGYRVARAVSPPPQPTTRLRPVNPRRVYAHTGPTQFRSGDSPDTRVCKAVLRDIINEICLPEASTHRSLFSQHHQQQRQQLTGDFDSVKFEAKQELLSPRANDDRPQLEAEQPVKWHDQSGNQQQKLAEEILAEDSAPTLSSIRTHPRVTSPVARQIVNMRDVHDLPFDQIARHFKLEQHVVRFAYVQLKKQSFRSVGRPRKSESEERKSDTLMPFVSSGRMPPTNNPIGIPSPAQPLPARYTSDELNIFLDVYRKEVMKRRIALEKRAEDETGILVPWQRTRSKNVRTTKRQVLRKDNPDEPYTLCDPRYISLGGNTVPFEEMPMKMELDFSGNAKITTQSDLLNVNQSNKHSKSNVADISMTNVENDESDDYEDENPSASTTLFAKKSKLTALGRTTENDDESEIDSNDSTSGDDTSEDGEVAADVPAKRARSSTTTSKLKNGVEKPTKKRKKNAQAGSTTKTKTANVQRRVLGQQQRRDRERRLHIIQVRKTKNADTPPIKKVPFGVSAAKKSKIAQQRSVTSTEKGAEAKYCSCGVTYDPKKTYISCGTCSRWYHAKCAGLTEKRAQKMAGDGSWTCGDCERSSDDVYCVCRRPYDDTKFYVGCDSCEDWFHPECIGTTQAEVSKQDTFLCPKCRESDI